MKKLSIIIAIFFSICSSIFIYAQSPEQLRPNNVVIHAGKAYAAIGNSGFAVVDLDTRIVNTFESPQGTNSVDDLCIADNLLFVLDASTPGALSVFSLAVPDVPTLVSKPVQVPVGPFCGVSAAAGKVVVSGGTSLLTVRAYTKTGSLGSNVTTTDLGIGQPDVLLSADGTVAFVSTDFNRPFPSFRFGITFLGLATPPKTTTVLSRMGISGAGFTEGFAFPANFPIESATANNTLLVAYGGGLAVIDIASNKLRAQLNLGFSAVNVDAIGNQAFVVGATNMAQVDISNPDLPQVVDNQKLANTGSFTGIAVSSKYIVVAANAGGLIIKKRAAAKK